MGGQGRTEGEGLTATGLGRRCATHHACKWSGWLGVGSFWLKEFAPRILGYSRMGCLCPLGGVGVRVPNTGRLSVGGPPNRNPCWRLRYLLTDELCLRLDCLRLRLRLRLRWLLSLLLALLFLRWRTASHRDGDRLDGSRWRLRARGVDGSCSSLTCGRLLIRLAARSLGVDNLRRRLSLDLPGGFLLRETFAARGQQLAWCSPRKPRPCCCFSIVRRPACFLSCGQLGATVRTRSAR